MLKSCAGHLPAYSQIYSPTLSLLCIISNYIHTPGCLANWLPTRFVHWEAQTRDWRAGGRGRDNFQFPFYLGNCSISGYFSSMTLVSVFQTCHGSSFFQLIYVSGFQ